MAKPLGTTDGPTKPLPPTPAEVRARSLAVPATAQVSAAHMVLRQVLACGATRLFVSPDAAQACEEALALVRAEADPAVAEAAAAAQIVAVPSEVGAGFAAYGDAAVHRQAGVVIVSSWPSAVQVVSAVAAATVDSVPLVVLTVPVHHSADAAGWEADIRSMAMPITKHSYHVHEWEALAKTVKEAFFVAASGRPGPVLIDVAPSVWQQCGEVGAEPTVDLPGYRPVTKPHSKQIREATRLLSQAKRPLIVAGGGVARSGAAEQLRAYVEATGLPVVTTLMARDVLPSSHPGQLGLVGAGGSARAVAALHAADVVLALGTRFDTGGGPGEAPECSAQAVVIHADIDPAEISKNRPVDVPMVGDCAVVLADLLTQWRLSPQEKRTVELPPPSTCTTSTTEDVLAHVSAGAPGVPVAVPWGPLGVVAARSVVREEPGTWVASGSAGAGFAVAVALGLAADQTRRTWAVETPDGLEMSLRDLALCVELSLPVTVQVIVAEGDVKRAARAAAVAAAVGCTVVETAQPQEILSAVKQPVTAGAFVVITTVPEPVTWPDHHGCVSVSAPEREHCARCGGTGRADSAQEGA